MPTRIRRLLGPPQFEGDADKTRAAWLLNVILLTLLARAVLIRISTGSEPARPSFFIPFVVLLLAMMLLMRVGAVRLASLITVAGFWASLTAAAVVTGGLHSLGFRNYILPVIVAGLLLGRGAALITAGLSIVAGLAMWAGGVDSAGSAAAEGAPSLEILITHAISLLMAAVLVTLATRRIEETLNLARKEIVDRRRAEESAQESGRRWQAVFDNAGVGIALVDRTGRPTHTNAALQKILGYTAAELSDLTFAELTHPDDAEIDNAFLAELREGKRSSYQSERRYTRKDGQTRWGRLTMSALSHRAPENQMTIAMIEDITDRRRAEDDLRASEERFYRAFNLSPLRMGIIRVTDGVVLDVNECWVRDMGYAREEVIGRPIFEMTHWIGGEGPRIRQFLESRLPVLNWEAHTTTKKGETRFTLVSAEPIELSGEPCLLWVTTDITERKRAEQALRESEELFRTAFESATAGICLVSTEGRFLNVNPTLCEMLGYSREELEGMTFDQVTHHQDIHIGKTFVVRALAGLASRMHLEKRYVHKDGHVLWASVSSALVQQNLGDRRYFITHIQDMTERKQAETERIALTHDLGERVKELTALHRTARLLQEEHPFNERLLAMLVALLPPAWQYPGVCEARITYGELDVRTAAWRETPWMQTTDFETSTGARGTIAVAYLEQRPIADEGPFLIEERRLLQSLADMLRAHLERKRAEQQILATSEQLRALMANVRSAKEEEGVRIAREIHDELGSALTSLRWDLEELERDALKSDVPDATELRKRVAGMFGLIDGTIDVVRRISSELRPSVLDDLGLAAAIEWQAQQFQTRTGIRCQYDCSAENVDLNADQSTAIFRIFQEALTNVLRHAQATEITVLLEEDDDALILRIRDNGRGIREEEKNGQDSLGLLGMRERAHLIGGRIEIDGTEGKGTSVTLSVPRVPVHNSTATT